jgi:DNA gyrase/topoisomerase IV subunit A
MKNYHEKQKARLAEFGKIKYQREQEKIQARQMEMENEINKRKAMQSNNEELKQKIRMYKEYKAQQILEL